MSQRADTAPYATSEGPRNNVWSRTFLLVCIAAFLAYGFNSLLSPVIPLRVVGLGGSSAVAGIILSIYSGVAFALRPFAGYIMDRWRATNAFGIGALLVSIGSMGWLAPNLVMPYFAQTLVGVGWAGVGPAGNTMVATLAPTHRRGEASGYYHVALTGGTVFIPAMGLWLLDVTNFTVIFLLIAVGTFLASVAILGIGDKVQQPTVSQARPQLSGLIDRSALLPSAITLLFIVSSPAAIAFLPLYARDSGIEGIALIFFVQGIIGLVGQGLFGRLSDRIGRGTTMILGFVLAAVGMVMLSQATTLAILMVGGAVYRLANGAVLPVVMAMVMDRAQPGRHGSAQATFAASIQLGIMIGALGTGYVIDWVGYSSLYLASLIPLGIGLGFLLLSQRPAMLPAASQTQ